MGVSVGIDVSKQHLDWALGSEAKPRRARNTAAGIRRLIAQLSHKHVERIIVESTGGYERALTGALSSADLPVLLVNPWRVRRLGEGQGILAKTDAIDAHVLALFRERAAPPLRPIPSSGDRPMADLVRRRRPLIAMIVAEKNRLEHATSVVRRDIVALVKVLERRVLKLDQCLDKAIEADEPKADARRRLEAVPCVGPGIARALVVDLPELGSLGRKQIASLVGIAPFANDSGKKSGVRRIRAGRPGPRTALYLAAMNASRFNPCSSRCTIASSQRRSHQRSPTSRSPGSSAPSSTRWSGTEPSGNTPPARATYEPRLLVERRVHPRASDMKRATKYAPAR